MKTFSPRQLMAVVVLAMVASKAEAAAPSCTNYTKGAFGPTTIDSEAVCRSACETAEGLPIGDYNSEPASTCNCKKTDGQTDRKICDDSPSAAVSQLVGFGTLLLCSAAALLSLV